MFSFLTFDDFSVFDSKQLGRQLLPYDWVSSERPMSTLISVRHGRAVAIYNGDNWLTIKGVGWQFGGPHILRPAKDRELVFGLLDEKAAKREKEVSDYLQEISVEYPEVIGYRKFADVSLPSEGKFILDITFNNGVRVDPCILCTKAKSPFRMADMAFLCDKDKEEVVDYYCSFFRCERPAFLKTFAGILGNRIGFLHAHGIINDSLYWDNITMCAEIVDYEWLTVPGMVLPNGEDASNTMTAERKEKEIVYAVEAMLRMADILGMSRDFYEILDAILGGYDEENRSFVENSKMLERLRKGDKYIC